MHVRLPGAESLKAKRSRLKPLLARLHREFNVSAAEVDFQDMWNESLVCCSVVSSDTGHAQQVLQKVVTWVESHWRDVEVIEDKIEMI